jgi:hypothetical protein
MNTPDAQRLGDPPPPPASPTNEEQLPEWAKGWLTLEELQAMANDEDPSDCLELKDFIEELRAIVKDARHGQ